MFRTSMPFPSWHDDSALVHVHDRVAADGTGRAVEIDRAETVVPVLTDVRQHECADDRVRHSGRGAAGDYDAAAERAVLWVDGGDGVLRPIERDAVGNDKGPVDGAVSVECPGVARFDEQAPIRRAGGAGEGKDHQHGQRPRMAHRQEACGRSHRASSQ